MNQKSKMNNKKIKPILKSNTYNQNLIEWIVQEFPDNYENMNYIDLYCDNLGVYIHKKRSKIEVINDDDIGIIQIYRAIRDEYKYFIKKINTVKCNIETFDTFLENSSNNYDDYLDKAVNEFVLRKMSKSESKKSYANKKIKWNIILDEIVQIKHRLQETFITNKEALEVLQKFNNKENIIYCNLPIDLREQQYNKIAHSLNNSTSKILITCEDQKICKKYFSNWKCIKKMLQKKNKKKLECVWKNY